MEIEDSEKEKVIIKRCAVRGWNYNVLTAYILETGMTPYELAKVMNVSRAAVHYWVVDGSLSRAVQFAFLVFRKIFLMYGVKVSDLF